MGSSNAKGAEVFGELNITKALSRSVKNAGLSVFASYCYNDARYKNLKVVTVINNALSETNYKDNKVEYAPENIFEPE